MGRTWVVDASPLIALAKVGRLRLLTDLAEAVLVPDAVAEEVMAGPESDPAREAITGGFGTRVAVPGVPATVLEWSLGAGESSVLAVALARPGSVAVLDDAEGRKCASALAIATTTTLGVVVEAKRAGLLEVAADVIRELRAAGLFVDEQTAQRVLARVGERWAV